jgi:hypothetical protein
MRGPEDALRDLGQTVDGLLAERDELRKRVAELEAALLHARFRTHSYTPNCDACANVDRVIALAEKERG